MSKRSVRFVAPSRGVAAGEVVEVDAKVADELVANGHAHEVEKPKPSKDDAKG